MKAPTSKDTIYIDIEDEITSIIDKVSSSSEKIVALVLPKRATALQSIVNMRLLKRSAEGAKKRVVLITSEAGLLPLAGVVGVHVARNLQSKPAIPPPPDLSIPEISEVEESSVGFSEVELDPKKSIGELSGDDAEETIELDDLDQSNPNAEIAELSSKKPKKDKKLVIPNFDKFRLMFGLGIFLFIGFIVFLYFALTQMPRAKITIKTDTTTVTASLSATTLGSAKTVDEVKQILPSQIKEFKQVNTEKVPTTGSRDLGVKAIGKITITNCKTTGITIPAGTGMSKDGFTFTIDSDVSLDAGIIQGSKCLSGTGALNNDHTFATVNATAIKPGEQYNLLAGAYNTNLSNVSAYGSAMTGGTTRVASIVSDADVDTAKQKINQKITTAQADFYKKLDADGSYVLQETAASTTPVVTAVPAVNEEGTETAVTQEITYSVLVVDRASLSKLLTNELNKQIDISKQQLSPGDVLDKAVVRISNLTNKTDGTLSVDKSTTATPIISADQVKKDTAGKKSGDIQNLLTQQPGIKDVNVSFSPFWVSSVPKKASKVTVIINEVSPSSTGSDSGGL